MKNAASSFLLAAACWAGDVKKAKALLDEGADPNESLGPRVLWRSPLHFAVRLKSSECALLLAERGARLEARSSEGATPLMAALAFGRMGCARALLEAGADAAVRAAAACPKSAPWDYRFEMESEADLMAEAALAEALDFEALRKALTGPGGRDFGRQFSEALAARTALALAAESALDEKRPSPGLLRGFASAGEALGAEGFAMAASRMAAKAAEAVPRWREGEAALAGGCPRSSLCFEGKKRLALALSEFVVSAESRKALREGLMARVRSVSILEWRCAVGDPESALLLMEFGAAAEGADLDLSGFAAPGPRLERAERSSEGREMFAKAVEEGDAWLLQKALAAGADADAAGAEGRSALAEACRKGWVHVADLLSRAGADPWRRGPDGRCALDWAAESGKDSALAMLLARTDDFDALAEAVERDEAGAALRERGWAALERLSRLFGRVEDPGCRREEVEALLFEDGEAQANPNCSMGGESLLSRAAGAGATDACRALLGAGADPKPRAKGGSPLWSALSAGNAREVGLLLSKGADPEEDRFGDWPLGFAAERGDEASALALSSAGADPLRVGPEGLDAVERALAGGHRRLAKALERRWMRSGRAEA